MKCVLQYLRKKIAVLYYKNTKLKKGKVDIFQKRLVHAFSKKLATFPFFF